MRIDVDNYAPPYQYDSNDSSNGFHPSAQVFLDESWQGFVASVQHLAEQTRRPWCPLTPDTLTPSATCRRDVGITGAKIAVCSDCVGTLAESPFGYYGSRQTTTAGSRQIVYRVQNFDSTTAATVQVTVSVVSKPTGSSAAYTTDLVQRDELPGDAAGGGGGAGQRTDHARRRSRVHREHQRDRQRRTPARRTRKTTTASSASSFRRGSTAGGHTPVGLLCAWGR